MGFYWRQLTATCTIFILLGAFEFLKLDTKFQIGDEKTNPVVSKNDISLLLTTIGQASKSTEHTYRTTELCQMMKHRDKPNSALKKRLPKAIIIGMHRYLHTHNGNAIQ